MTAIATARTMNCTNRVISRVKRKKSATIPTIPRNSGPKRLCRYETRPCVLIAACGAAAARIDTDIILPFRGHQCACEGTADREARPTVTRTWSLGSHRLRRCTDVLYIPSCALLVDDRHVVSCRESRRPRSDLAGKGPVHGDRDVACRPALRNLERGDAAKADRTAKP